MENKECLKCNQIKVLSEFPKDKYAKNGYSGRCKVCKRNLVKECYLQDPEAQKTRVKNWNTLNPEKVKQYNQNNIEYQKQYYLENKEQINKKSKEYNISRQNKNPGKYYHKGKWVEVKPKLDKLERRLINTFRDKIRRGIQLDRKSSLELLGCSFQELKSHLQDQFYSEMDWSNWGKVWEIDHIIGCVNFNLSNPEELIKCFHYTNLRPLFKTTNVAKSLGYMDVEGNRNRPRYH
jgi:hypothetical protein